jgi:hypothetical protein
MVYMKPIRVLVANRPLLMREAVVTLIAEEPDIQVVGETSDAARLTELIDQLRPDVLVLALDEQNELLSQCGFFLGRYPDLKVLAVSPDGNRAIMYWATVDIRHKPVEHSGQGLLSAMREPPSLLEISGPPAQELQG